MVIDGSMVRHRTAGIPAFGTGKGRKAAEHPGRRCGKGQGFLLNNERNATLCELGIGTNYAARLTGVILEDEKAYQTVHIAFGTNIGFGGTNKADCHIDGIIKNLRSIWMMCSS